MNAQAAKPNRLTTKDERLDAAIAHLESVAAVCQQKNKARVIPFPRRARLVR